MSLIEFDSLIVENLSELDATTKRIGSIEKRVFDTIDEFAASWARKSGWYGSFDYLNDEFWLAPLEWHTPESEDEDDYEGWFIFESGFGDTNEGKPEEDFFDLTRLCQCGSGMLGFRFDQSVTTRSRWRKLFKDVAGKVAQTAFSVDAEPSFFLPVKIDCTGLSNAIRREDIEFALKPFDEALSRLVDAKPTFDEIIARMRAMEA